MKMKVLSETEKSKLRVKVRKELQDLTDILSQEDTVTLLDSYKNEFNRCETACKVVFAAYLKAKSKSKKQNKEKNNPYLKLDMRQIPAAMNFAGYSFESQLLDKLFSGKKHSAKKLRDAVTHGISKSAVREIKERQNELFRYMEEFICYIRDFDAVLA